MQKSPPADRPTFGALYGTYLARVVSVRDEENLSRVKVRLLNAPEAVSDTDAAIWARVAVPFAGGDRGAFFLPDVDDEVAVVFVGGDPRQPLVVGGLWSGSASPPEQLGGAGDRVDRYAVKGKRGSRIAMVEETEGQATITVATPGNVTITVTQANGGKVELEASGNKITIDTQGITLQSSAMVKVQASKVDVSASMVSVDAAMSSFSGMVKCDVLKATTVIGTTYTPGAGNTW